MQEGTMFHGLPLPDFSLTFDDHIEIEQATKYWRVIVDAMFESETLSLENAPLIAQLVIIQAFYDRSMLQVAEHGAVLAPKRGNTRAISRINPHFTAMTKLSADALALENALGLTPRTRGKVSKTLRSRRRRATASDEFIGGGYLKILPGGKGKPRP